MNIDAALRLTARVDGSNNIRALQGSLQQLNQATRLSKAELGQWNIEINRAARSSGNTIAGLRAHAAALTQLRERVEIGSRAYQRFSQQIDATNAKLRQATTLSRGAAGGGAAAGGGTAGLAAGGLQGLLAGVTVGGFTAAGGTAINAGIDRTESERRLRSLTQGLDDYTRVQQLATDASRRFGISQTEANVSFAQLYARLRPVGIELADIASAYNGFNTAAKLSGASATEAQAAFLQLSQALGSGVLRGEELNSIFEQTPTIVQAIAREMDIPIGQLRKYAEQGKITSDIVLAALRRIETEGAGRLAESLNGPRQQVINLQNAFQDLQVAIATETMPAVISGLRGATQFVKSATVEVDLWAQAFRNLGTAISQLPFSGAINGMLQLGQSILLALPRGIMAGRDILLGNQADAARRWSTGYGSNWNEIPGNAWPAGVPRPAGMGGGGGTTRPPAAAAGGGSKTRQAATLVQLARAVGFSPQDAVIMAAIGMAESGGNPRAFNGNAATGDKSFGLWQINMLGAMGPERRRQFGISNDSQLFDPVTNAMAARKVFESQGFGAWSVFRSGAYRQFLGKDMAVKGLGTDELGGDIAKMRADMMEAQEEERKLRAERVASAKEALAAAEAQLEIQRETDPLLRLQLEYEEKKRALAVQYTALKAEAATAEEAALIDKRYHVEQTNALVQYEQQRKQLLQEQRDLMDQIIEKAVEASYEFARGLPTLGNAAGGFMDGIDGWIEGIGTLRESVQQLTISGIGNLENALVELVTTGKTSFRQLAVSILQDTARMIIQQLVLANVLRMVQNLFGGFGGGGGLFGGLFADGGVFPSGLSFNPGAFAPGVVLNANGNAFGKGGIQPFAQGGVVTQPTLFQFAGGGAMRNGLMGEAGPEAIMPLRRGRDGKLGVMAGGGGTSVVVNVDASGTRAQGDSSRANMVGRELGAFVEQKILEMKRPGGLLAAT